VLAHYNGRKMIALSESGTLPNADAMDTYDIGWTYFSLWKDGYLDDFPAQDVQALLGDERVITLNELPTFAWKTPGDYTNDGLIDAADYVVWRDNLNRSVVQFTVADGNGNGLIDQGDFSIWRSNYGSSFAGAGAAQTVPEPSAFVLATILLSISLHRSYRHRSHQPLPTGRIV
jgi:hypothetical protein